MANVSFDKQPGFYDDPATVQLVLSSEVESVQYTVNAGAPSISKYVAYDASTPPVPFIAVTQDGLGNVVYDGGFPKFYNNSAPPADVAQHAFEKAIRLRTQCTTTSTTINSHYYEMINRGSVAIVAGDRLVYDLYGYGSNIRMGVDALMSGGSLPTLRHVDSLVDQNGIAAHAGRDITAYAKEKWYHREFDLTPVVGTTLYDWSFAMEGDTAEYFTGYLSKAYVLDRNGAVKFVVFDGTLAVPETMSVPEAGISNYTFISKDVVTPMGQLTASFKFLYNAINFIANPTKFAAGNRKILLLGDKSSGSYWIKGTSVASDFALSFLHLAKVANVQLTIKDTSDWPEAKLNPTLAELNQYAAVILMSSESALSADRITEQAIDAMVLYREQGNGLMVITDHGPVLNTIEEAIPSRSGFFNTANRLITRFGCWFSGDYNRTPVNVGFLRSTYGDHPLYAGMADSESIYAGASESRVWVAQTPSYLPGQVPSFQIAPGRTTVQVAASLKDGSVEILRVYYYVLDFKVTFTGNGQAIADSSVFDAGIAHMVNVAAGISGTPAETVAGILYVNDVRKGTVGYTAAGGSKLTWDSGVTGSFLVNNGDTFKVILSTPLNMTAVFTVKRFQPVLDTNYVPNALNTINSYAGQATPVRGLRKAMADLKALPEYSTVEFTPSLPRNLRALSTLFKR